MNAHHDKLENEQIEVAENEASSNASEINAGHEKGVVEGGIPNEARDQDVVTLKTWLVICVCPLVYGRTPSYLH